MHRTGMAGLTITDVEPMAPGAMLQFSTSVEVRPGNVGPSVCVSAKVTENRVSDFLAFLHECSLL